jgi:circadian clock protein KaiC
VTRSFEIPSATNRTSTGVPGLDELIEGGFPANRAMLVCGGTGTGKTTFGLQFIHEGLQRGEAGTFVSVDEKPRHLLEDAASLGLQLEASAALGTLAILDASPYFTATRGKTWSRSGLDAREVSSDLTQQVRKTSARRLVIDPITSLVPPDLDRLRAADYLRSLIQSLEDNLGCTILFTAPLSRHDPQGACEAARYLSSGILELRLRRGENQRARTLCIRKMRGSQFGLSEYPFRIERGTGLTIVEEPDAELAAGLGPQPTVLGPRQILR